MSESISVTLTPQQRAREFVAGAFGPFGVDQEPYVQIIKELIDGAMESKDAEIERLTPYVEAFRREEDRADKAEREIDDLRAAASHVLQRCNDNGGEIDAELVAELKAALECSVSIRERNSEIDRLKTALFDIALLAGKRLTGRQRWDHALTLVQRALGQSPEQKAGKS
jgi:ElaB/YqjD/DUF883 family membrane-anchored ribosome-binding protein